MANLPCCLCRTWDWLMSNGGSFEVMSDEGLLKTADVVLHRSPLEGGYGYGDKLNRHVPLKGYTSQLGAAWPVCFAFVS
jgi:hypothetical protein